MLLVVVEEVASMTLQRLPWGLGIRPASARRHKVSDMHLGPQSSDLVVVLVSCETAWEPHAQAVVVREDVRSVLMAIPGLTSLSFDQVHAREQQHTLSPVTQVWLHREVCRLAFRHKILAEPCDENSSESAYRRLEPSYAQYCAGPPGKAQRTRSLPLGGSMSNGHCEGVVLRVPARSVAPLESLVPAIWRRVAV